MTTMGETLRHEKRSQKLMSKKRSVSRKGEMIGKYKVEEIGPGKGTFGQIYQVSHPDKKGDIFALKKINLAKCTEKDKEHCQREAQQLKRANHIHIVAYIDSFQTENFLCIVMEYCKGGNLRDYIQQYPGTIKEEQFLVLFKQICEGLKYLHDNGIAHRDVKTTNILLTEDETIKIADLGLAKVVLEQLHMSITKGVGSPIVMSPEMLAGKEYTLKTDIWSLGCCMYEIGTKTNLFKADSIVSLMELHRSTEINCDIAKTLPYCTALQAMFGLMIHTNSHFRPSVGDILTKLKSHSKTHIKAQPKPNPILEPGDKTSARETYPNTTIPTHIDSLSSISSNDIGAESKSHSKTHRAEQSKPKPEQGYKRQSSQAVKTCFRMEELNLYKTCPPRIESAWKDSGASKDSGVDTDASDTHEMLEGATGWGAVTVEVHMNQEQKEYLESVKSLEGTILRKIDQNKGLLNELRNQIRETKSEETHGTFLEMAKKTLGENLFKKCRIHLMSLWLYKTDLLNANFKMA